MSMFKNIQRIQTAIKSTHSTEKADILRAKNVLTFLVSRDTNKVELLQALQGEGLEVVSVNIVNVKGKRKDRGQRKGRRKDYKKAYVKVASLPESSEMTAE